MHLFVITIIVGAFGAGLIYWVYSIAPDTSWAFYPLVVAMCWLSILFLAAATNSKKTGGE